MKTKFKLAGILLVFIAITMTQLEFSKESDDVMFFNIEALAYGESTGYECFMSGSVDCPSGDKVYAVY